MNIVSEENKLTLSELNTIKKIYVDDNWNIHYNQIKARENIDNYNPMHYTSLELFSDLFIHKALKEHKHQALSKVMLNILNHTTNNYICEIENLYFYDITKLIWRGLQQENLLWWNLFLLIDRNTELYINRINSCYPYLEFIKDIFMGHFRTCIITNEDKSILYGRSFVWAKDYSIFLDLKFSELKYKKYISHFYVGYMNTFNLFNTNKFHYIIPYEGYDIMQERQELEELLSYIDIEQDRKWI